MGAYLEGGAYWKEGAKSNHYGNLYFSSLPPAKQVAQSSFSILTAVKFSVHLSFKGKQRLASQENSKITKNTIEFYLSQVQNSKHGMILEHHKVMTRGIKLDVNYFRTTVGPLFRQTMLQGLSWPIC